MSTNLLNSSDKLRICLCTTFYPPHSFEVDGLYIQRLARVLAKCGHEVTVVCNIKAFQVLLSDKRLASVAEQSGITLHALETPGGLPGLLALHQSGRPLALKKPLAEIFSKPFDVIHYYNTSLLGGPGLFEYGDACIKIAGLSDHWLVCPMHILWNWRKQPCHKPQCIRCSLLQGRPPQWWRYTSLMRRMVKHIDVFLGPSQYTINKHQDYGFTGRMLYLPLFYKQVAPEPINLPTSNPYFLCVGRLKAFKGFQEVIPLFQQLSGFDLIICGDGPYDQSLKSLASGSCNIHFLQQASAGQLQYLLENAMASIIPSLAHQTFSHVAAESFSAGTPVIAHSHSSVKEIIGEYGGGLLYGEGESLQQCIYRFIQDGSLRLRLQKQAAAAFTQQFSETVYVQRYLELIRTLLEQKKRHGVLDNNQLNSYAQQAIRSGKRKR